MPGFDRWRRTWERLQASAPGPSLFEELVAHYREPHRAYHTLQHLEECFEKLKELEDQATRLGEVELALWFHDAVYDVGAKDNEAKSAEWARTVAAGAGVNREAAERIHGLVMCTVHDAVPAGTDQRILVDVDLSILGAPEERFDEYETQIRVEYAWVPDAAFRAKRRDILQAFLDRPAIFGMRVFRNRYETQARGNLQRSIRTLTSGSSSSS